MHKRPTDEGDKARFEPAARLALDIGFEVTPMKTRVGVANGCHLQRVLVRQDSDQLLLVGPKAFHG
jgi:hypothetical protein